MSSTLSVKDAIALINASNSEIKHEIYIPSMGKTVNFAPMNATHYKKLIEVPLHGIFGDNKFSQIMFSIIKDTIDPTIPLETITVLDKDYIILQLRAYNVSPEIEFSSDNYKKKVLVSDIVNDSKKIDKTAWDTTSVDWEDYTVSLSCPNIVLEYIVDKSLDDNEFKKTPDKTEEYVKQLPALIIAYDVIKYISSIKIKDNIIDCSRWSVADRITLFDTLPSRVIREIIMKLDDTYMKTSALVSSRKITVITPDGPDEVEASTIIDAGLFI